MNVRPRLTQAGLALLVPVCVAVLTGSLSPEDAAVRAAGLLLGIAGVRLLLPVPRRRTDPPSE